MDPSDKIAQYQALIERLFSSQTRPDDEALTDAQIDEIHEQLDSLWESMSDVERATIEEWRRGQRGDA